MLVGEHRVPGAAHAGLHFIDDQGTLRSRELAQRLRMKRIYWDPPPSPRTGSSITPTVLSVIGASTEGDVVEVPGKPGTWGAYEACPSPACREADMVAGAAVEGVVEGDDLEGRRLCSYPTCGPAVMAPSLASAPVLAKNPVEHRVGGEQARQLDHRAVVEGRAGVEQRARLLHQRIADLRRAVAEAPLTVQPWDAVEVALALVVVSHAPSPRSKTRSRAVGDVHQGIRYQNRRNAWGLQNSQGQSNGLGRLTTVWIGRGPRLNIAVP